MLLIARPLLSVGSQEFALAHGNVTYIGSWLTIVVSTPELGPTTLPLVMFVLPDFPGNRRDDIRVAEIDLCGSEIGFGCHDCAIGLLVRGKRLVAVGDAARTLREQILRSSATLLQ